MRRDLKADDPFLRGEGSPSVLRVLCTSPTGSVPAVLASGDVDAVAAREIGAGLAIQATPLPGVVVLDLSAARVDAAALWEIEAASSALDQRGMRLLVVPPREGRELWDVLAGVQVLLAGDLTEALVRAVTGAVDPQAGIGTSAEAG